MVAQRGLTSNPSGPEIPISSDTDSDPLNGIDIRELFEALAACETQLKPFAHELEELGL
jgi:hypothetical protein